VYCWALRVVEVLVLNPPVTVSELTKSLSRPMDFRKEVYVHAVRKRIGIVMVTSVDVGLPIVKELANEATEISELVHTAA